MGSEEVMENSVLTDVSMSSCNGMMVQHTDGIEESENLGADLLKDFDLCWEDFEDRLTVSRMVNDSVVKGMVSAVEQEAEQKIAQKELELTRLKAELHLYHVGADENDSVKKLNKEIHKVKESCSMRRRNSASEILGLSGILPEKVPDKWSDMDRMLEDLGATLDSFYKHTDDMVCFSKLSLFEWQQEREFQAEIEGLVVQNYIRGLQEEFEQSLWDQNTQLFGNGSASWLEKVKKLSSLRQELDAIAKSLFVSESGQLISYGSFEHRMSSGHHVSNGNHDESIITMPENLEAAQLKHMNREELFHYLKTEMTKMKRHHESKVQEMTEEIFILKREYFKERGSSLPVRKDKDLDILRKKIPGVILKLDDILVENEKMPFASNNAESLDSLKNRLESLRLENRELRDLLAQKKREIKLLSSQVSDATEKMSQHSLTEVNLLRTITNLKSLIDDTHIGTTISEDLHKILLKELVGQIKCFTKESDREYDMMEGIDEIIFREAAQNAKSASKLGN
ncbi:WPP DOMAIN-ASSOCIATED PROTEIN [Salix koriyanagi]|uniref:WPP DOMAIN-ASSOCIATED PROTEIN n=1 Tax=Salix koriyanagi TaxID=2511006 RepID=A0A9Q0UCQ5_9ROSI|nr:WPP DOMAIN-ASSOCIATED PROTEIN [Salix koriyanagi]